MILEHSTIALDPVRVAPVVTISCMNTSALDLIAFEITAVPSGDFESAA